MFYRLSSYLYGMNDNQIMHCIYILVDENGVPFYVGKTINPKRRLARHIEEVRKGNHLAVYNKLRQVLTRNGWKRDGTLRIIETGVPDALVDARETFYISEYKKQGIKLKNLTEGGEGGKGFTREIIERGAAKRRGRPRSEICKRRISEAMAGIPFSDKHRKALRKAWKTRMPISQEVRNRVAEMNRGTVNIKRFIVLAPSGETFTTERGLMDFCRQYGLDARNLHSTLNGRRKHHRGWKIISCLA